MKKKKVLAAGMLAVGVDIAKNTHVASAQVVGSQELTFTKFIFENTTLGYESLLKKIKESGYDSNFVIGIEPTGHYWENFAYYLKDKRIKMVFINPLFTKRMKDIEDNTPSKTDSKDSRVITFLMLQNKVLEWAIPTGVYADLKILSTTREQISKDLVRKANQLHSYVDRVFPGFTDSFKSILGDSSLYLIKTCPRASDFLAEDTDRLIDEITRISQGFLGRDKIMLLKQKAETAYEVNTGVESLMFSIRTILAQIAYLKRQKSQIERRLNKKLKEVPYAQHLLSIDYLGKVRLACILGQTGDLREFSSSHELLKFAGLNLYEISSGLQRGKKHITKRGRPLIRKHLYMAVLSMIGYNKVFSEIYREKVKEGKVKMKVIIALMRKLLKILFALAKKERYFQEDLYGVQYNCLMRVGG